jgi:mannitol-specific phosphotransferase system IIBC component
MKNLNIPLIIAVVSAILVISIIGAIVILSNKKVTDEVEMKQEDEKNIDNLNIEIDNDLQELNNSEDENFTEIDKELDFGLY